MMLDELDSVGPAQGPGYKSPRYEAFDLSIDMAPSQEPTQPAVFTDELRAASRQQHANNTAVVASKLIVVLTHRQQYGRALCCFWHVHAALEAHLAAACASVPGVLLRPFSAKSSALS